MAREFNGTNQSLRSASTIDLSGESVVTAVFWLYVVGSTGSHAINLDGGSSFNVFVNNSGTANVGMYGPSYWYDLFPQPSADTWHHYIVEFDRVTPQHKAWVDNADPGVTTYFHISTSGNFSNAYLDLMSLSNVNSFLHGRVAEVAIYSGTLSGAQRTALQTDAPNIVGSPLFHWPICGVTSPEPAGSGGIDMTVNNGATFVADPLVLNGSLCTVSGGNPWNYYAQMMRKKVERTWDKVGSGLFVPSYAMKEA